MESNENTVRRSGWRKLPELMLCAETMKNPLAKRGMEHIAACYEGFAKRAEKQPRQSLAAQRGIATDGHRGVRESRAIDGLGASRTPCGWTVMPYAMLRQANALQGIGNAAPVARRWACSVAVRRCQVKV